MMSIRDIRRWPRRRISIGFNNKHLLDRDLRYKNGGVIMARPGYMSIYADERTQGIFDEFCRIKGITKSTALTEMLDIYMLRQDEELYTELKKKALGIESARQMIAEASDVREVNDYVFMKLATAYDTEGNTLDGEETIGVYIKNCDNNGLGYTWFSTQSLHSGMQKKKVEFYNRIIKKGEIVKILFAVSGDENDIKYSARILEIVSSRDNIRCPGDKKAVPEEFGENETGKIWIKITDISEETKLSANMMVVGSTGSNLKQVISNSQFHFGYVNIPEE